MKRRIVKKQLKLLLKKARRVTIDFGPADEMTVTPKERDNLVTFIMDEYLTTTIDSQREVEIPMHEPRMANATMLSIMYGLHCMKKGSGDPEYMKQLMFHATDDAQKMVDEDIEITIL